MLGSSLRSKKSQVLFVPHKAEYVNGKVWPVNRMMIYLSIWNYNLGNSNEQFK